MERQSAPATATTTATATATAPHVVGTAQGVDMKANRRSSTLGSLAEPTHAGQLREGTEIQSRLHGAALDMEMMVDVMLEDSHYLDKCAERQRAGAANPTAARFAHVDQGSATGGSRRMVELADLLALPVPADLSDEDMLLFDEFVGQGGEATATMSTCKLLFRSIQSELLQRRPCCNEDAGKARVLSLPHAPSDTSLGKASRS
jgi:hypothetical protein